MPATAVTVNTVGRQTAIVKPTPVACDNVNSNSVTNAGNTWLELTSSAGGTVTVVPVKTVDGQAAAARTYTLTGVQTRVVGWWPPTEYGSVLTFTASAATITVIAYQGSL